MAGWIFMKAMEGPQERLRTELSDKKRGTTDKTVDNETELMVKMLRVGGEASLRLKKIQLTTGYRASSSKGEINRSFDFLNEILDSSEESKTNEACNLKTVSQLSRIV